MIPIHHELNAMGGGIDMYSSIGAETIRDICKHQIRVRGVMISHDLTAMF